jgi:type VI secretion system protein ImpC
MSQEALSQAGGIPAAADSESVSKFESLLQERFKLATDEDEEGRSRADKRGKEVRDSVRALADEALKRTGTVTAQGDVLDYIQALIKQIDDEISKQLSVIMHHPDFTKLEGAWRGLYYLVSNTETDANLKIRVMNITKKELFRALSKNEGVGWDRGPIFMKIYEEEFGMPGGEPYAALIGDFEFDHSPQDMLTLREMSKIAAASHCPFIAAARPNLMQMDSWQELSNPRDLGKILATPEYAEWRGFRESEDSRFVGLTMPRFLARLPYSTRENPIEGFAFEETIDSSSHQNFVWSNSAYAMGANIARAFKMHGWCARIRGVESGGMVDNLKIHAFPTDDGGVDIKCPTEIGITDRREKELATLGLMPLSHWKNTNYAVFVGAQSVQKPAKFYDDDATANANLSARLPYLFACCRFAHYLKCMVRDKVGSYMERDQLQQWLQNWIQNYVTDSNASEQMKMERPLAAAEVTIEADPEDPGVYRAEFSLRPHYQLEEVNIGLRLVSRLPRDRKA